MSHSNARWYLVGVFMISAAGCAEYDSSEQVPQTEASHDALTSPQNVQQSAPPPAGQNPPAGLSQSLGPLTIPSAATPMNSDVLKATLTDANIRSKLRASGLELASIAGVTSPKTMYGVAVADHQDAETAISGSNINDHASVYVIVMTGGPFIALDHPQGVPAPQGTVLTATMNAATFRPTDIGIINAEPDLSKVALARADL